MTEDWNTTNYRPDVVGAFLPPWKMVIDLNNRIELDEYFQRYGSVEVTRNGETRAFTPEEFFAALAKLAEKPRTCHMVRCIDEYRERQYQDIYECDKCGERIIRETCMYASEPPRYCPGCGAEVTA